MGIPSLEKKILLIILIFVFVTLLLDNSLSIHTPKILCFNIIGNSENAFNILINKMDEFRDTCHWIFFFYNQNATIINAVTSKSQNLSLSFIYSIHREQRRIFKLEIWHKFRKVFSLFDYVLFSDEDISFQDFDINEYINFLNCTLGSVPIISQPTLYEETQYWPFVHRNYYENIAVAISDFIEIQIFLIDGQFFSWLLDNFYLQEFTTTDFGLDYVWCKAAIEYSRNHNGALKRIPCAVVPSISVHHLHFQTLKKTPSFLSEGMATLKKYKRRYPSYVAKREILKIIPLKYRLFCFRQKAVSGKHFGRS